MFGISEEAIPEHLEYFGEEIIHLFQEADEAYKAFAEGVSGGVGQARDIVEDTVEIIGRNASDACRAAIGFVEDIFG